MKNVISFEVRRTIHFDDVISSKMNIHFLFSFLSIFSLLFTYFFFVVARFFDFLFILFSILQSLQSCFRSVKLLIIFLLILQRLKIVEDLIRWANMKSNWMMRRNQISERDLSCEKAENDRRMNQCRHYQKRRIEETDEKKSWIHQIYVRSIDFIT
jgi:uncharacterized protein YqhQ